MPIRHSKTRTGCRVCKRKRLKCDETTPACLNCVRRGVECPGYPKALRWSTKHETLGKYDRGQSSSTSPPPSVDVVSPVETPDSSYSKITTPSSSFAALASGMMPGHSFDNPVAFTLGAPPRKIDVIPPQLSRNPVPADSIAFLLQELHVLQLQTGTNGPTVSTPATLSPWAGCEQEHVPGKDDIFWNGNYDSSLEISCEDAGLVPAVTSSVVSPFSAVEDPWETQRRPQNSIAFTGNNLDIPATFQHIPPALNDPSTLLVEFWFRSVCEGWAAYDSPSNPFRRLCAALWTRSGSVYYSIQSMAAASFPAEHSPNIQQIVLAAPEQSTKALIHEIQTLFHDHNAIITLPAGLLVSLFCMSSSVSWIDSRQLGTQYLRNARAVIELLDLKTALLSRQDRELLEFFRGCLIYEEMLRSIVSDDEEDFSTLIDGREPLPPASRDPSGGPSMVFHAWTGIPTMICWLLGKVMVLFRRSRSRRGNASDVLREAKVLEEKLLATDTSNIADISDKTTSYPVPPSSGRILPVGSVQSSETKPHLHLAAEAFRLCALLQLYQAFPELISLRLPADVDNVPGTCTSWLSSLALHIIEILKEIPSASGMRCLQPLLCIFAGSALVAPIPSRMHSLDNYPLESPFSPQAHLEVTSNEQSLLSEADDANSAVQNARNFLRGRLYQLEHLLPRKPVTVAGELLEEIWASMPSQTVFDSRFPIEQDDWALAGAELQKSWLDIIATSRFQSVFG